MKVREKMGKTIEELTETYKGYKDLRRHEKDAFKLQFRLVYAKTYKQAPPTIEEFFKG